MLKSSSVDFAFSFVTKECTQKVLGVTENVKVGFPSAILAQCYVRM